MWGGGGGWGLEVGGEVGRKVILSKPTVVITYIDSGAILKGCYIRLFPGLAELSEVSEIGERHANSETTCKGSAQHTSEICTEHL